MILRCMFSPTTGKFVDAQESISKEDLEDELELHHVEASVEQISPTVFVPQLELGHPLLCTSWLVDSRRTLHSSKGTVSHVYKHFAHAGVLVLI